MKTYSDPYPLALAMNALGKNGDAFLFVIDYEMKNSIVLPVAEVQDKILFDINGYSNVSKITASAPSIDLQSYPIDIQAYTLAFEQVMAQIKYGNSFLLNLTFPTPIRCNLSLAEIFHASTAKYKLLLTDHAVVFSPETFVTIDKGIIRAHPMKGTIDASLPGAKEVLLNDAKEAAEHATIVDLLRNDLSLVAKEVRVDRYRYLERLQTNNKDLYQMSSQISGKLADDYGDNIGDIITALLPAGSISGAPKAKTVEIIAAAEQQPRGYYTGVAGYYDGQGYLDAGVLIRYIEQSDGQLLYRSGCGITHQSTPISEYQEMLDKVYVPIF